MAYPKQPACKWLADHVELASQLQHEYGAKGIQPILKRLEKAMQTALRDINGLSIDRELAAREPNALKAIKALRPAGPRRH